MTRAEMISQRKKILYTIGILVAAMLLIYTAMMMAYESITLDLVVWQIACALIQTGMSCLGIWIEETRAARRVHRDRYIIG